MGVQMIQESTNITDSTGATTTIYATHYANIYVDVNGKKAPNRFGKDVFWFRIDDGNRGFEDNTARRRGIYPYCGGAASGTTTGLRGAITQTSHGCKKGATGGEASDQNWGTTCACLIMYNGWNVPTRKEYIDICTRVGAGSAEQCSEYYPW